MKLFAGFILSLLFVYTATAQSGNVPAELVGKWVKGSASIMSEQNMTTGAISSRYGDTYGYTINADGTYSYVALLKSTMYGCTTSLFNNQQGSITIEGDVITFSPSKDYWLNTNSCYPSANKEKYKEVADKSFNFETGVREGKTWLCIREVGKTRVEDIFCYPRSQE